MPIDSKIDDHRWEEYKSLPNIFHHSDLQNLAYLRSLTPEIKEVKIIYQPKKTKYESPS